MLRNFSLNTTPEYPTRNPSRSSGFSMPADSGATIPCSACWEIAAMPITGTSSSLSCNISSMLPMTKSFVPAPTLRIAASRSAETSTFTVRFSSLK